MAAAVAPPAGGAAPVLPPTAFLMALKTNPNVSAACLAGEYVGASSIWHESISQLLAHTLP